MDEPTDALSGDADLALAIARGDRRAEEVLYERFSRRIFYLARRELRSHDLAEDARSETFLRVIAAIRDGRLRSAQSLASFVLQTTRFVAREAMRQRQRTSAMTDPEERAAEIAAEPVDIDMVDAVRDVVRALPPRDREFVRLFYYEELSTEAIANRLEVAPERVRLIKSRALQRLRRACAARRYFP
jgi:RNA polymerase sigma-70 factor (ECF subfamily)